MHKNFLILLADDNWTIIQEFNTVDEVNTYLSKTTFSMGDLMVVQYIPIILKIDESVLG